MSAKVRLLSARVPEKLYRKVREVSESHSKDISDFIRRALLKELAYLSYIPDEQKKALGIVQSVGLERETLREASGEERP